MEDPFSGKENDRNYMAVMSAQMASVSNVWSSNFDDSFGSVAELMNFDAYAGWCNTPGNFAEQMFPSSSLAFSSGTTNFSPLDGFTFTDDHNSEVYMVDGDRDTIESSSISKDKVIFHQIESQFPVGVDTTGDGVYLINHRCKSSNNLNAEGEARNNVIIRSHVQTLDERMLRALYQFKEWLGGGILAQVWVPKKNGDDYVLSTCEQPYLLDEKLSGYREVSRSFTFDTESKPGAFPGLPGRVYNSKIPEWTSNVRYYNKAEYLRVHYAVDHEIRGSIALPIFEDSLPERCCAVLELVTVKEKSNFDLEIESVCRALQTVNLRSTVPPKLYSKTLSKYQRAALVEITDVLCALCHAHRLPLALTWIPCSYIEGSGDETKRLRAGGYNMAQNKRHVLCIEDTACYVNDKDMQAFVHACAEHYLEKGQGIAGKALQSNHPFFYPDIKEYHISEYPLVHHARKFGLNAAVAIRLRSTYTGDDDYILELFLPVNMKGSTEQQQLLNNLSSIMQRICKSLRTVSEAELPGIEDYKQNLESNRKTLEQSSKSVEQLLVHGNSNSIDHVTQCLSGSWTERIEGDGPHDQASVCPRKHMGKKRSAAEKNVSLRVLQQYFSGSLKDAAKSIGVCPTTLKRICRHHGISRWPSRKINKVNRSLRKIQSVLESVQGVESGLKFNSTMGGLVASSSIIQDIDPQKCGESTKLIIQRSNSIEPSPSLGMETMIVKMEDECLALADGNRVNFVSTNCCDHPDALHQKSLGGPSDEIETNLNTSMNGNNEVTEHVVTDSSDGSVSLMNGSSSSTRSFGDKKNDATFDDSGSQITIKATYKEDIVRFKFAPADGWIQLYEEVAKRFQLQAGNFQLKYLDDEKEWVMLASESDLQECVDILNFQGSNNVKFLVRDLVTSMGSSGSSNYYL